jgi:hypothetical protein
MALELRTGACEAEGHACSLPWPKDPEMPEGHACECGQRWVYQPARWEALYTMEDLCRQQAAGAFLRGIVPTFRRTADRVSGGPAVSAASQGDPPAEVHAAVILPIPSPKAGQT